jgi:hypothetical protein
MVSGERRQRVIESWKGLKRAEMGSFVGDGATTGI